MCNPYLSIIIPINFSTLAMESLIFVLNTVCWSTTWHEIFILFLYFYLGSLIFVLNPISLSTWISFLYFGHVDVGPDPVDQGGDAHVDGTRVEVSADDGAAAGHGSHHRPVGAVLTDGRETAFDVVRIAYP